MGEYEVCTFQGDKVQSSRTFFSELVEDESDFLDGKWE